MDPVVRGDQRVQVDPSMLTIRDLQKGHLYQVTGTYGVSFYSTRKVEYDDPLGVIPGGCVIMVVSDKPSILKRTMSGCIERIEVIYLDQICALELYSNVQIFKLPEEET